MFEMTHIETTQDCDFAVGLFLSYIAEDPSDRRMTELFRLLHELHPKQFARILVLAAAIKDRRFDEYGLADAGQLLRTFEPTDDLRADVERFLELMQQEDELVEKEARAASGQDDTFARQAEFFLRHADPASRADLEAFLNFKERWTWPVT